MGVGVVVERLRKKWFPLSKTSYEKIDSRKNVFSLKGDSRYGILYSAPADIAEMSRVNTSPEIEHRGRANLAVASEKMSTFVARGVHFRRIKCAAASA